MAEAMVIKPGVEDVEYCYTMIDSIQQSKERKNEYFDQFRNRIDKIINEGNKRLLYDEDILHGTFAGCSEKISVIQKVPRHNINGETLLFRVLSMYDLDEKIGKKDRERAAKMRPMTETIEQPDTVRDAKTTLGNFNEDQKIDFLWEIIKFLTEKVPEMIIFGKKERGEPAIGYSPFYLAIVKKLTKVIRLMVNSLISNVQDLKVVPMAEGYPFGDSIMLAATPLGVAALTMEQRIFRYVLRLYPHYKLDQAMKNKKEDNIIHSMIKYIQKHSDQLEPAKRMLSFILNEDTWAPIADSQPSEIIKQLVQSKNDEHLTPLQLAAKRQQFDIFSIIIQNENYCMSSSNDGLTLQEEYDITELETLPLDNTENNSSDEHSQKIMHFSVLEFVYLQPMQIAFKFADCRPVRKVIKEKWSRYRLIFYPWFVLHLLLMCILSWSAIERSRLHGLSIDGLNPVREISSVSFALSVFCFICGIFVVFLLTLFRYGIYWCCFKRFGARIKANFCTNMWRIISSLPYTNNTFEIFFSLFAFFLIIDFPLAYTVSYYQNQCLMFAVIIGWYLVLFFLQVIRRFSFFTVLIQRVLKDMLNFAMVMAFLLVGFTVAMFMLMQGATTDDDSYSSFSKALVKMFTVMLGMGEVGDLFSARQPALAVIVFALFVLLTTILLLNALIALMSNSCTELMSPECGLHSVNKMHEILQKLSVIIVMESFLWPCLLYAAGRIENSRRIFDVRKSNKEDYGETDADGNIVMLKKVLQEVMTSASRKKKRTSRKGKKNNAVGNEDQGYTINGNGYHLNNLNQTIRQSNAGTLEIIRAQEPDAE